VNRSAYYLWLWNSRFTRWWTFILLVGYDMMYSGRW